MVNPMKAEISGVIPGSIGAELGVEKGDFLISINGIVPQDLIDYRYLSADEYIDVEIEKPDRQRIVLEIEKDADEDLGLVFTQDTFDGMKRCKNKCIFCFVDQMPPNLRDSLYIKDDDYRLSLLYGNFITLTNMKEADLQRIMEMHISPIYISVHSTEPEIRKRMLNNPQAGKLISIMTRLAEAGIEMHTQVVLCPGINDGEHLAETIATLQNFWPQVKSVAVVPVGITKYQKNPLLRSYTPSEAKIIIRDVTRRQEEFKSKINSNFVFLADEFYLLAGEEIPSYDHYEGFPQIENGVGLVRYFWHDFQKAAPKLPQALKNKKKFFIVTGISGGPVLEPIIQRLNEIKNLEVNLIKISNDFFGRTVTVTGLLTGHDLILGLEEWRKEEEEVPEIFISSTMLKYGADVFLDNTKVSQVAARLNCKINVLEPKGESLVTAIKNLG